jgi:hypothetical protein
MTSIAGLVITGLMIAGTIQPTTGWIWGILALFAIDFVGRALCE